MVLVVQSQPEARRARGGSATLEGSAEIVGARRADSAIGAFRGVPDGATRCGNDENGNSDDGENGDD
eukprot:4615864-Pyramimonas_sp.AAC.1